MPQNGYAWWYIDGLSADRRHGLSIIAFIGSVFSPYYAARRRRGAAEAEHHVALNVARYGAGGQRWTMTERGRSALRRDANHLVIGPSRLAWRDDGALVIDVDEISVPFPRRVRGRIVVEPIERSNKLFALDHTARHHWQPVLPRARLWVTLDDQPAWSGHGYLDHNRGVEPLESCFRFWSWSRTIEPERTRIFYDMQLTDGARRHWHLEFVGTGAPRGLAPPPLVDYGRSLWRLPRAARTEEAGGPRLLSVWEDGPFYARNLIEQRLEGALVPAVHELLSLERFERRIVQLMLPFRMPRRG